MIQESLYRYKQCQCCDENKVIWMKNLRAGNSFIRKGGAIHLEEHPLRGLELL